MAFVDLKQYPSRKAVSVAGVVLVHLALGYAFVNGLAYNVIKDRITVLWAYQIEEPKPPKRVLPPEKAKQRTKISIPDKIEVTTRTGDKGPEIYKPLPLPPLGPIGGGISTSPPQLARMLQVKGDRSTWVTTVDYPAAAIRNGEEGRVEISVRVATNGRVSNCQVTGSSGHPALDEATCYFYAKRARFLPAVATDGTPVEASRVDSVRWQLPTE